MKTCALFIGCLLIIASFQVSTYDTGRALPATPDLTQLSGRVPITVDNARQLKQVGRIGRGLVNDLAWSPDRTRVAVASCAGLWLYAVKTPNAQPHVLGGDAQNFTAVAFAPDGKRMATASSQGIQLWDVQSEEPVGQAWGDGDHGLRFHPDGKRIAVSTKTAIQLWDLTTQQPVGQPFPSEESPFALSADGAWLATGLKIWDINSHRLVIELQDRLKVLDRVLSVAFDASGTRLAATDYDSVTSWSIKTGGQIGATRSVVWDYPLLEFDKRGALQATYLTGFPWADIEVYNVDTRARLLRLSLGYMGMSEGFQQWQFGPDGRFIVVHRTSELGSTVLAWNTETQALLGSWADTAPSIPTRRMRSDGSISVWTWNHKLWEWKDGKAKVILTVSGTPISSAFTPDETGLVVAYNDGTIRVWDIRTGRQRVVLSRLTYMSRFTVSPDGKYLAAWGDIRDTPALAIWNIENGTLIADLQHAAQDVVSLAFRPDSRVLAACDSQGNIWLWQVDSGQQIQVLKLNLARDQGNAGNSVEFSPDGMHLIASARALVSLWDLRTGTEIAVLDHYTEYDSPFPGSSWFSPDGHAVVLTEGREIRLYDVGTGQQRLGLTTDYAPTIRFSPDSSRLVVFQKTGIQVWQVASGKLLFKIDETFDEHGGGIKEFSPDGAILLLAKSDGVLQLYEGHTGERLTELNGHTDYVYDVVFSPDRTRLLTIGADGTARLWAVQDDLPVVF